MFLGSPTFHGTARRRLARRHRGNWAAFCLHSHVIGRSIRHNGDNLHGFFVRSSLLGLIMNRTMLVHSDLCLRVPWFRNDLSVACFQASA